jgi:hypothetical protein
MDDEPVLLHEPDLMLAILRAAQAGPADLEAAMARLAATRAMAGEGAPKDPAALRRRLEEAAAMLEGAEAIAPIVGDRFRLTERGAALLEENVAGVDQSVLRQFPEFRGFMAGRSAHETDDDPRLPAFAAGLEAFGTGCAFNDNPYAADTPDHLAWEAGWSEARDDRKRN